MSDDPFAAQGDALTVTLKYGKDFGDPWLVVRGGTAEETKQRVADAVGLEGWEDLTLAEVIINAKNVIQGANTVASTLGGTAIPRSAKKSEEQAPSAQATAPQEPEGPSLAEQIEGLKNKRAGQQLYLTHRSVIDADADLKAAITEKMKSL